MISIFRKIRRKFFSNKVSNYLLYAIGEIILVMIGILLALQVNNWNEERKQNKELIGVLKTIHNDMVVDTTSASGIIKFYQENSKNSIKIINREVTMDNYKDNVQCFGLVTTYQPFNIQRNGFERLKMISETNSIKKDSLINDIITVYSQFLPLIDKSNERMENEIMSNFNAYKNNEWFVDLFQNNLNDKIVEYFVLSEDYRKRVVSHNILAARNHLALTKSYVNNVEKILESINHRLTLNESLLD
ncbi:DUF6090 family protein [uncultured Winogradskyella sp.]|uniref:DUF6090 family protein n=1 Tax=uncultured Winogradskyella sp. TaxID=395353 RepID=UPI002616E4B8|nr:DUF6090 family protein [uncultured Winogradskyella sp.]